MYKKHVDTGKLTHLIIKFYINSFFFCFFLCWLLVFTCTTSFCWSNKSGIPPAICVFRLFFFYSVVTGGSETFFASCHSAICSMFCSAQLKDWSLNLLTFGKSLGFQYSILSYYTFGKVTSTICSPANQSYQAFTGFVQKLWSLKSHLSTVYLTK